MNETSGVSPAFATFLQEASGHAEAWMNAVRGLDEASALDPKTEALAYLAVLAAVGLQGGVPFHVREAKAAGAARSEVISAVLVGLPAAGQTVIQALHAALSAYDAA